MTTKLLWVISILGTASIASAEPSRYVATGAVVGSDERLLSEGGTIEGGARLTGGLWLHAEGAVGATERLAGIGFTDLLFPWPGTDRFAAGNGMFEQARLGLEQRACTATRVTCLWGGVDVGVAHTSWSAEPSSPQWASYMTIDTWGTLAVARAGLDIGGKHLRVRPSVEGGFVSGPSTGGSASLGLAYQY